MIINQANLSRVYTGFHTAFNVGVTMAAPQHDRVAMRVPSTTAQEQYGWLAQMPGFREWLGERVLHNVSVHDYTIKNKAWEQTITVLRDNIEDDSYGLFAPLFTEMGRASAAHPSELVYGLLKAGFGTLCYDGQYFFDTDHPVLDASGTPQSVANTDGGSGTPWFLIDTSRAVKPVIWQVRKDYNFVSMQAETDPNVFFRREFVYGVDARSNVGYGLWQLAWGSKQTLDAAHFETARAALGSLRGDYGRPLGIMPNLLVVPPSLESAAKRIVKAERDAAGATNVNAGTADLLVVPWLA